MYCGTEIVVEEAVRLAGPGVAGLLALAEAARTAGNAQDAYEYYSRVLEIEPTNHLAWFGKAESAGNQSGLTHSRITESIQYFKKAIEYAGDDQERTKKAVAEFLARLGQKYYEAAQAQTRYPTGQPHMFGGYTTCVMESIAALEASFALNENRKTLEQILIICKSVRDADTYNLVGACQTATVDRLHQMDRVRPLLGDRKDSPGISSRFIGAALIIGIIIIGIMIIIAKS